MQIRGLLRGGEAGLHPNLLQHTASAVMESGVRLPASWGLPRVLHPHTDEGPSRAQGEVRADGRAETKAVGEAWRGPRGWQKKEQLRAGMRPGQDAARPGGQTCRGSQAIQALPRLFLASARDGTPPQPSECLGGTLMAKHQWGAMPASLLPGEHPGTGSGTVARAGDPREPRADRGGAGW